MGNKSKKSVKSIVKNIAVDTTEIERGAPKEPALKVLSGKEVISKIEAKIVEVEVAGLGGAIRCKVPDHKTIYDMKMKHSNNEAFQSALFKACLVDFTEEDLDKLEEANGIKYFEMFSAVMGKVDMFTNAMKESKVKN